MMEEIQEDMNKWMLVCNPWIGRILLKVNSILIKMPRTFFTLTEENLNTCKKPKKGQIDKAKLNYVSFGLIFCVIYVWCSCSFLFYFFWHCVSQASSELWFSRFSLLSARITDVHYHSTFIFLLIIISRAIWN
jgi:hypothetical protein